MTPMQPKPPRQTVITPNRNSTEQLNGVGTQGELRDCEYDDKELRVTKLYADDASR